MEVSKGQKWAVMADLPTGGITMWRAPFTGGLHCVIPAGTVLVVDNEPPASASAVYCLPVNYRELEPDLVPAEDRLAEKYDGYALVISLVSFGDLLTPA